MRSASVPQCDHERGVAVVSRDRAAIASVGRQDDQDHVDLRRGEGRQGWKALRGEHESVPAVGRRGTAMRDRSYGSVVDGRWLGEGKHTPLSSLQRGQKGPRKPRTAALYGSQARNPGFAGIDQLQCRSTWLPLSLYGTSRRLCMSAMDHSPRGTGVPSAVTSSTVPTPTTSPFIDTST